jgi:hypothetical protein
LGVTFTTDCGSRQCRHRIEFSVLAIDDGSNERAAIDPPQIPLRRIRGVKIISLFCNMGHQRAIAIGLVEVGRRNNFDALLVLRRARMKYEDVTIENIWSQFGLVPALREGKVDAVVSWEPYVTQALEEVPDSFLVIRGDPSVCLT